MNASDPHRHRIRLTGPAGRNWEHAMPIGNGRLGAMIFGNVGQERIGLNEESIWSRSPIDRTNPDALNALPNVRHLLLDGKPNDAEFLAEASMMGAPSRLEPYQEMGTLTFGLAGHEYDFEQYQRWLDLDTATAGVRYVCGGATFERAVFVSAPDEVLVIHLTCDRPGGLSAWFELQRATNAQPGKVADDTIELLGRAGEHGTRFRTLLRAMPDGGSVRVTGRRLHVEGADTITLLLTAATDYRGDQAFAKTAAANLDRAAAKAFDTLCESHVADHRQWFDRMALDIAGTPDDVRAMPTPDRLARVRGGADDPDLARLAFDFGRYLMISASRPGGLPMNLQGIWAQGLTPQWSSDFHVNINMQMNYWPAEVCGLSELAEPLFDWLSDCVAPSGRRTAKVHYGCDGWVLHHISDPWGFTVPGDGAGCGLWPMGGAWLCDHAWERYLFTGDQRWLADVGYPLMRGASAFFLDYLMEDERGRLLCGPSDSPENRYRLPDGTVGKLAMGCTMDNMILRELFGHTIEAAALLGVDAELRDRLAAACDKLPPLQIGRHGQIREWMEDHDEPEPGHRHVSHLFGLHPGTQIDPWRTPGLLAAARRVLERRLEHGGGQTGWSRAWMINFHARLLDAELAHQNVRTMLSECMLPNLFDTHPPLQIDGNFGFTAGVAEMLVQSHADRVALLPAWPEAWASGSVRGLKLRGGATLDMTWAHGKLTDATLHADRDQTLLIQPPAGQRLDGGAVDEAVEVELKAGEAKALRIG